MVNNTQDNPILFLPEAYLSNQHDLYKLVFYRIFISITHSIVSQVFVYFFYRRNKFKRRTREYNASRLSHE